MTAQEQVLYFIAANDQPTDATPIMIGLFLFTQDLKAGDLPPVAEPFEFVPMSHGPGDMKIYCVLDVLCKDGHVAKVPVPGEAWSRYRVTTEGQRAAAQIEIREHFGHATARIRELRQWCDRESLTSILEATCRTFPEYARNTVQTVRPPRE